MEVPEVLLSGNHEEIRNYRYQESLRLTKENRPDLLEK
jgi:tRNA (guanine37-N1)-methyltransferase